MPWTDKQEIERLKAEIQRLTLENAELRARIENDLDPGYRGVSEPISRTRVTLLINGSVIGETRFVSDTD